MHRRRTRVERMEQVIHRFCGVWDNDIFVGHGFHDMKVIFRLHLLD